MDQNGAFFRLNRQSGEGIFVNESASVFVWIGNNLEVNLYKSPADDTADVPEWQKEAVRKTLQDVQQQPEQLQPWDIVKHIDPEAREK